MTGFEYVLPGLRRGDAWRRAAWKPDKFIRLHNPAHSPNDGAMSFIAIVMANGSYAPWTPTRCDLLEQDWIGCEPMARDSDKPLSETGSCTCASHQQPHCAHWRMGKCEDKPIPEGAKWKAKPILKGAK